LKQSWEYALEQIRADGAILYAVQLWKTELTALAADTGLAVTGCDYPPGTSQCNRIKHKLFSAITRNWQGRPDQLPGHRTPRGHHHPHRTHRHAEADTNSHPEESTSATPELPPPRQILLTDKFQREWNCTVKPAPAAEPTSGNS
jgi:hypothetical protein